MRILVSNDDGVHAPGLLALYNALKAIYTDVYVMAPDSERSGSSNAITITQSLQVTQLPNGFYAVNGTPADCVYMGCNGFFEHGFDLVVTGINSGANLGDDVLYSGTIGAAREGRILDLPSVAVSLAGSKVRSYTDASAYKIAAEWVAQFIQAGLPDLPPRHVININIPDTDTLAGAKITKMGKRKTPKPIEKLTDPRNKDIYWIGLAGEELTEHSDKELPTDFQAVSENFVSITPIQMDATSYSSIGMLQKHIQNKRV